jgi:tRNA pseudouridine38-40 synthase
MPPPRRFCCKAILIRESHNAAKDPPAPLEESRGDGPLSDRSVRLKLTIAYDGTNYAGWQVQKTGIAVQELIEKALKNIFGIELRLHGSSRTDAGVHARALIAHVDIPRTKFKMAPRKLSLGLNAYLPEDIRIMRAARAPANFHARFDAIGKQYRYFIYNHAAMDPLLRAQAWHVPQSLDLAKMRQAAGAFVGKHDFEAFAANRGYKMESTVRTVTRCEIRRSGPLQTVIIEGDGFLYKMCRGIVGTLVQVGQEKFGSDEIPRMMAAKNRSAAGMSAPAHGLVLWKVFYSAKDKTASAQQSS